jgi:hypothetical protein
MSTGGGLLDLVARGKKDTFFTSNPKVSFIHSVYKRCGAFTQEIRYTQPRNNPEWGHWTEFEIESIGDIMKNPTLLIDLPSWLPPKQTEQNLTSITTDQDGVQYGYCRNIGINMIEKVQIFSDQIMIQEYWGHWLQLRIAMSKKAPIYGTMANRTDPKYICHAATPPRLYIPVPMVGNQANDDQGFPIVALKQTKFRIRIFLRKIEEVIEASDKRINPNPWAKSLQQQTLTHKTIDTTSFTSLQKYEMKSPIITLETTQIYVPRDVQELLKKTVLSLPFIQTQLSKFTIESNKWPQTSNSTVSIPYPLDFTGTISRLIVFVQNEASILAGQQYDISDATGNEFLKTIRLNSGTIDRLNTFSTNIWCNVANYYKNERQPCISKTNTDPANVYTLTFGQDLSQRPLGTFNMSRVNNNAMLYVDLAPIMPDPRTNSKKAYLYVFAEAWNVLEIKDGVALVLFAD